MTALRTSASAGADGPVVVLSGEADATTAAQLREMLATQLDTGARRVTVDASGLSFLDSASMRVLILAARALQGRHGTLVFARPQPLVARLLEITGADRLLDVRALAGAGPALAGGSGRAGFTRVMLNASGCGNLWGAVMTLAARMLVARAEAANRKAARKRRAELVRELAGYAAADRADFEATLGRYPPEVTRELRSILARQYMAAEEARFPAIGR